MNHQGNVSGGAMRQQSGSASGVIGSTSLPQSIVDTAINDLSSAIAQLGGDAQSLANRLVPVLSSGGNASSATDNEPASSVPVVQSLDALTRRVREINAEYISSSLARLAV